MNKEALLQLIKSVKDNPQEICNKNIAEAVDNVLLPTLSINGYIEHPLGKTLTFDKPSIGSMDSFLKDFKVAVGMKDSSQIGIEFAIEYAKALQDFAQKTNAKEDVVREIDELLEALNK